MPYVVLGREKYHYSAMVPEDPKEVILFVHGSGGSHRHWQRQLSFLGRSHMVLAVDLPGHGLSEGKACDSIKAYREFVCNFAEKMIGVPFYLGGHSMGGAVALDFSLEYPEKLKGLFLVGTGSRLKVLDIVLETFRSGRIFSGFTGMAYGPEASQELLKASAQEIRDTPPYLYYCDLNACNNFDAGGRLGEVNTPTLVISAEKDVLTPPKYGKFLAENIKGASFEIIPRAGHMMMLEKPDQFNGLVQAYIESKSKI